MKLKYFGILKNISFEKLTEEEQIGILVDKKLYDIKQSYELKQKEVINLNEFNLVDNQKLTLSPSYKLKAEFELFILSILNKETDKDFFLFFKNFDNDIFGVKRKNQKKIAVKHFKEIYANIDNPSITLTYKSISKTGIEHSKSINKFIFLKSLRTGKLTTLMTGENLEAYLIGDSSYFQSFFFKEQKEFKDALNFEINLKILLSLNDKYQIHEDNSFTKKSVAQKIYEDYQEDFESLLQLQFIEKQILDSKLVNRAFVLSIFHFFKKEISINTPSAQFFGEIVNSYFNFNFGKLKENSSISSEHDKRVDKLKKDWKSFLN